MSEHDRIAEGYEEIAHERERLLSQARLQKATMVRLLESPDFKTYAKLLQEQIDKRYVELLQMPLSADDVIKKTYTAGELTGIKLALDYPQVLIDYAQTSIDSARIEEENEHGESTPAGRNADSGNGNGNTDQSDFFDRNFGY